MTKEKSQTKSCLFCYKATDHNIGQYYLKSTSSTRVTSNNKPLKHYAPTENGEMAAFYMQIFMVYCAQYLANETELRQNILHTNYWW